MARVAKPYAAYGMPCWCEQHLRKNLPTRLPVNIEVYIRLGEDVRRNDEISLATYEI